MNPIRTILLIVALLIGAAPALAQEPCNRNVEPQGGFSICVPQGWTASAREGEKYKLYFAPRGESFVQNINFKEDTSTVSLDQYATAGIAHILKNYASFGATTVTNLTKSSFTTQKGLAGIKATFHAEYKGLMIRTIQYYFHDVGRKIVLTCTGLEADEASLVPVCDRAAKSFQLEAKSSPAKVDSP